MDFIFGFGAGVILGVGATLLFGSNTKAALKSLETTIETKLTALEAAIKAKI